VSAQTPGQPTPPLAELEAAAAAIMTAQNANDGEPERFEANLLAKVALTAAYGARVAAQERPAPSGEPLTHFFHCWRFPDHHACAVALIERQAEENDRLLAKQAPATGRPSPEQPAAHREKGSPSS
jgi:hypothetical protein